MNAIIALCHFCEYHGPSVLFYTQAFHCEEHNPLMSGETSSSKECGSCLKRCLPRSVSESSTSSTAPPSKSSQCEACRSLEPSHSGYISYDREAHISYYSNRYPEQQELYSIVRQACVRSLSCEVCPGREGPMFFGEEVTGYVFTHTFFLKDINARGFQRWYSIIAVMKDRIYLINSWPFLCSQFREIIDDLQAKANTVYAAEQAEHPQRTQHLQSTVNGFMLAPDHFRRQRSSGNLKYRSIADLTRDKSLFAHLHKSFAWILKACGIRVTERLLEGPPKEELLTDLEADDTTNKSTLTRDVSIKEDGQEKGCQNSPRFKSLRHMLNVLGRHYFHLLAYHVIQGNQLIVRGGDKHVVQSALNTLKMLIPSGCCQCIPYSTEYKDSWRCNFLGLAPEVEIPSHVLASDLFVLLDITGTTHEISTNNQEREQGKDGCDTEDFDKLGFVVCGKEKEPSPTLLLKIEHCLDNANVTDNVFEQMLVCLKEEWMDKVKVVFKFARSKFNTQEEKEKLLQILGAKPEDEIVLKFWMTGLNRQYRSHLLTCSSSPTSS